ncbi:MAG: hypothetical protein M1839_001009 [Geoglossum umbratile]|nr:MAG: hypothetical protein M1839_001009 [Geoglossum umbratile]
MSNSATSSKPTTTRQPPPTAPPSTTALKPVTSPSGLQAGVVAGIAIGVAFGVAIVTALAVLLLMRKYYSRLQRPPEPALTLYQPPAETREPALKLYRPRHRRKKPEKAPRRQLASPVPQREIAPTVDFDRDLPQSISDSDLGVTIRDLSIAIKNHVTNCYHREPIDKPVYLDRAESNLFENPATRREAIRQYMAKVILDNISPTGDPDQTFLPQKIVSILGSMPEKPSKSSPFLEAAFSRWKTITKVLLFPSNSDRSPEYQPNFDTIQRTAESISDRLKDYEKSALPSHRHSKSSVSPLSHQECVMSLEQVMLQGANLGIDLLSQGASFQHARWEIREPGGRPLLVVFPEILRMTDENGYRLPEPVSIYKEIAEDISRRA